MTNTVARVDIFAAWRGAREIDKANRAMRSLSDWEQARHKRQMSNIEASKRALEALYRLGNRALNFDMRANTGGWRRQVIRDITIVRQATADLGRNLGQQVGSGIRSTLSREIRGIGQAIPLSGALPRLRSFIRGGIVGGLTRRLVLGPGDILKAPFELTKFIHQYLPGAALMLGLPVLVRQVMNAIGAAVAGVGPVVVGAFGLMQKGVQDFADKVGMSVEKVRELHAAAHSTLATGEKLAEAVVKFSGNLDTFLAGNFKRNQNGELSAEGKKQAEAFAFYKNIFPREGGPNLLDVLKGNKDPVKRFETVAESIRKLLNGESVFQAPDGKRTPLTGDAAAAQARKILEASLGKDSIATVMRLSREANRESLTVPQLLARQREDIGTWTDEASKTVDRLVSGLGNLWNIMTGSGTEFFKAKGPVVAKWVEDLGTFMRDTRDARVQMMKEVFEVNEGKLSAFFGELARPRVIGRDSVGNALYKNVFFDHTKDPTELTGSNPVFSRDTPGIQRIKALGEMLKFFAAQASEFIETVNEVISKTYRFLNSSAGKGITGFGKTVGGVIGGFFDGLIKAFENPHMDPRTRLNTVLSEMIRGGGVHTIRDAMGNLVEVNAETVGSALGTLFKEFMLASFRRGTAILKETAGFLRDGSDFLKAFKSTEAGLDLTGNNKNDLAVAMGEFFKAMGESFVAIGKRIFAELDKDGLAQSFADFTVRFLKHLGIAFGTKVLSIFTPVGEALTQGIIWLGQKLNEALAAIGFDRSKQLAKLKIASLMVSSTPAARASFLESLARQRDESGERLNGLRRQLFGARNDLDEAQSPREAGAVRARIAELQQKLATAESEHNRLSESSANAARMLDSLGNAATSAANKLSNISAPNFTGMTVRPAPTGIQHSSGQSAGGHGQGE